MTELNFEISVKEKAMSLYKKRINQRKLNEKNILSVEKEKMSIPKENY